MTFYNIETPSIEAGKLVLISNGGSRYRIGVRQALKDIATIEASSNALTASTMARLAALQAGIALWKAQ